jgi:Fic family protein
MERVCTFPNNLYDEAWVGANYNISGNTEQLQRVKQLTAQLTSEEAERKAFPEDLKTEEQGTIYDWVHALVCAERTHLMKSFEEWTIEDIKSLSALIMRYAPFGRGGEFRKTWTNNPIREPQEEDWTHVKELIAEGYQNWSTEDRVFVTKHFEDFKYSFMCHPDLIESKLRDALDNARSEILKAKAVIQRGEKEGETALVETAARAGYVIGTIHPFEDGHRRLVRLMMAIILIQNGIPHITFDNRMADKLVKSARSHSEAPFIEYSVATLEEQSLIPY